MDEILNKIYRWLHRHTPVLCADCGNIKFRKDVKYERYLSTYLPLCKDCWEEHFTPFSKEIGNGRKD